MRNPIWDIAHVAAIVDDEHGLRAKINTRTGDGFAYVPCRPGEFFVGEELCIVIAPAPRHGVDAQSVAKDCETPR